MDNNAPDSDNPAIDGHEVGFNHAAALRRRGFCGYLQIGYIQTCVRQKIYESARDGMSVTLYALLANLEAHEAVQYLNEIVTDGQMRCTPLIIAAKNGHDNVVKMLLMKFQPSMEIEGCVQFDGYLIDGATALWSAAGAGHLNVVRTLVQHGADINHPTETNSTPLRAACFDGRLDIVRYLVEQGADIHISNKYNNTCLMIAAYKGHLEVVEYLLSLSSDPDVKALCGATALHFAAENGHLAIIKSLLSHGATVTKNVIGMTPVMAAAERTKAHVVEYFISTEWCTELERVEVLELLGASYANDKDAYNLEKAFYYMEWAMRLRFIDSDKPLLKPKQDPIPAYDNRIECQSLQELEAIQTNVVALHMEALVIRERILGQENPELPHPIIFRGAVYADHGMFDKCLQLWLHALRLRTRNKVSMIKDLLRFAQVFSQIINIGQELPVNVLTEVLAIAIDELNRNQTQLMAAGDEASKEALQDELDDNLHTVLYLLVIVTKISKFKDVSEEFYIHQLVYKLNRLQLRTKDGSSLLHLCVNAETPVNDFYTKNICKFPCANTTKLLIKCGADVNAVDAQRNTPLHIIVAYQKPISDFLTLHAITTALIDADVHLDSVNDKDETPSKSSVTGVAEIILKTQTKLSLKCMAARAVKKFDIHYFGLVPVSLVDFIEMHGRRNKV